MWKVSAFSCVLAVLFLQPGVAAQDSSALQSREALRYDEIMAPAVDALSPIENRFFMPGNTAGVTKHSFSGVLAISESLMITEPKEIEPKHFKGKLNQLFPDVAIRFFTVDDRLVPADRGLLEGRSGKSPWQMFVSPGRIWSEDGDDGYSRASFPFALTNKYENETYNGVGTFLFNESKVSYLRYQIVHQLTPYLIETWFVASGHIAARYMPGELDGIKRLTEEYALELSEATPMRNWSALEKISSPKDLANFGTWRNPDRVLTSGLIIDNVIYAKPTQSPYGPYPYLYEMRHGVWSVTKSMLGMVTTLRMAQKYGDEIFGYAIKDYVDITATHDGFDSVTIRDALNMATGVGGTGSFNVDPNHSHDGYISDTEPYNAWYLAPTAKEKLAELSNVPDFPWGSGVHVRYRDRDYFLLAAALQAVLQKKEGPDASLWEMMKKEVYGPIGIRHMTTVTTFETDGRPGVPHMGYGLYMTLDDIAKVTRLLHDGGKHDGEQLLSRTKLSEAFYRTSARGLPTGAVGAYGLNTYHMSIWHTPFKSANGKTFTIRQMLGWGGIVVALMPNGMTGFKIGNAGSESMSMAEVANRLRPFGGKRVKP